jgi:hypothetical protein
VVRVVRRRGAVDLDVLRVGEVILRVEVRALSADGGGEARRVEGRDLVHAAHAAEQVAPELVATPDRRDSAEACDNDLRLLAHVHDASVRGVPSQRERLRDKRSRGRDRGGSGGGEHLSPTSRILGGVLTV